MPLPVEKMVTGSPNRLNTCPPEYQLNAHRAPTAQIIAPTMENMQAIFVRSSKTWKVF